MLSSFKPHWPKESSPQVYKLLLISKPAQWFSLKEIKLIFKELKYLFKVGVFTWNLFSPKPSIPFFSISFPQEKIINASVIAWQTLLLHIIFLILFKPIFEKIIGLFDKYSKLSSYKFWISGIQAKREFSFKAYVLLIEKENDFNFEKSDIELFDM